MVPFKAMLCLALLGFMSLASAAVKENPNLKNIPVKGTVAGKKATGYFSIIKFVAGTGTTADKLIARGQLTLVQNGITTTTVVDWALKSPKPAKGTDASGRKLLADCQVLNLVLGPLNLNLLGLGVDLNQVILNITANPLLGLLGSILCAVAGPTLLGQLAALNTILSLLGL